MTVSATIAYSVVLKKPSIYPFNRIHPDESARVARQF